MKRVTTRRVVSLRAAFLQRLQFFLRISAVFLLPQFAHADFIGGYSLVNFSLTNSDSANGYASPVNGTAGVLLTGPNDGSGSPGTTDLTITALAGGLLSFDYFFTTLDPLPGYDYGGYLLSGSFFQVAQMKDQAGTISVPVLLGDVIGFRVGSTDNQGEPGSLWISNFSAPAPVVPEPGGFWLALTGAVLLIGAQAIRLGRRRAGRLLLAGATLVVFSRPAHTQVQQSFTGVNVTGNLVKVRSVNISTIPLTFSASSGMYPEVLKQSKRLVPQAPFTFSSNAFTAGPMAGLEISTATDAIGFNALSHLDQRSADGGNQFSIEPPNTQIAVGNGYVLEGVNNAIEVYSTSGSPALPIIISSNQLFGLPSAIDRITGVNGPYLTDMRVYYDATINRWFVLQRGQDNDLDGNPLNASHLYMAVSKTPDPRGEYNIYVMETTNAGFPGCPCIADYPQIGSDQYGFHIAWNQFNTVSYAPSFISAVILSVSKASLLASAVAPTAYKFTLPLDTTYSFSIQPAATPPKASNFIASGGVEYFVSSAYLGTSSIGLWAMTNTASLATAAPSPVLIRTVVPTLTYSIPPVAEQRPGPLPYGSTIGGTLSWLDGGDSRTQTVTYSGGRLYVAIPTGVYDEDTKYVVGAAYIVLSPTFRSGVLAAMVLNQGYLLVRNNHLLRPAFAVNPYGSGAIAVTLVGPDWYPTAALIPMNTFSTPSTLEVVGMGSAPEDGFSGYPSDSGTSVARWGDYNAAVASADGAIWTAVQYIGNHPRSEFANWNTWISRKNVPSAFPAASGAVSKR